MLYFIGQMMPTDAVLTRTHFLPTPPPIHKTSKTDETALMALLRETAARVEAATAENVAMQAAQAAEAADFSRRATAEVQRIEAEQKKLAEVQNLRADIIQRAEEERQSISGEADVLRARIADAKAAHVAQAAVTAEAERELQKKLKGMEASWREREQDHYSKLEAHTAAVDAKIAAMHSEHEKEMAGSKERFATEVAAKEQRLSLLEATEQAVKLRATELAGDGTEFVTLSVGGEQFAVSRKNLAQHPQSTLAVAAHSHISKGVSGPVPIDGDPTHFQLVCSYLRRNKLPVTSSGSNELQWLEGEAEFYNLDELARLCKDA